KAAVDLPADNTDFVITLTDGSVFKITLDPTVVKDVQGIIDAIELQTDGILDTNTGEISGNKVTVEINDEGGLKLTDTTFDKANPGAGAFQGGPVKGLAAGTRPAHRGRRPPKQERSRRKDRGQRPARRPAAARSFLRARCQAAGDRQCQDTYGRG